MTKQDEFGPIDGAESAPVDVEKLRQETDAQAAELLHPDERPSAGARRAAVQARLNAARETKRAAIAAAKATSATLRNSVRAKALHDVLTIESECQAKIADARTQYEAEVASARSAE
jgi:hypothetical protein